MVDSLQPWTYKTLETSAIACVPAGMLSPSSKPRNLPPAPMEGPMALPGPDTSREKSTFSRDKLNRADIPSMSSPVPMDRDAPRVAPIGRGPVEATRQLEPQAWNRLLAQREEGYREREAEATAAPAETSGQPEKMHGPYTFNTGCTTLLPKRVASPPPQARYFDYTRGQFAESLAGESKLSAKPPLSPSSPSVDMRVAGKQGTYSAQSTRQQPTQSTELTQPRFYDYTRGNFVDSLPTHPATRAPEPPDNRYPGTRLTPSAISPKPYSSTQKPSSPSLPASPKEGAKLFYSKVECRSKEGRSPSDAIESTLRPAYRPKHLKDQTETSARRMESPLRVEFTPRSAPTVNAYDARALIPPDESGHQPGREERGDTSHRETSPSDISGAHARKPSPPPAQRVVDSSSERLVTENANKHGDRLNPLWDVAYRTRVSEAIQSGGRDDYDPDESRLLKEKIIEADKEKTVLTERVSYLEYVLEETCRESKESLQHAHQSIRSLSKKLQEKEDDLSRVRENENAIIVKKESAESKLDEVKTLMSELECEKVDREAQLRCVREELSNARERLKASESEKNDLLVRANTLQINQDKASSAEAMEKLENATAQSRAAWESAAGWRARSQAIEEEKLRLQEKAKEQAKISQESEVRISKLEAEQQRLLQAYGRQQRNSINAAQQFSSMEDLRNELLQAVDAVEAYVVSGDAHHLDSFLQS